MENLIITLPREAGERSSNEFKEFNNITIITHTKEVFIRAWLFKATEQRMFWIDMTMHILKGHDMLRANFCDKNMKSPDHYSNSVWRFYI